MTPVFVDTAGWIALLDASDALHSPALHVMKALHQRQNPLVTTELVFIELANALAGPGFRTRTIGFVDRLRRNPDLEIVAVSEALVTAGWALYRQRPDKAWGLIDCTSFVVMQQRGLHEAFTADHHFEQAGFVRLLATRYQ